jgi:hypothetical protein
MAVPKTAALPLGDAPTAALFSEWAACLQGARRIFLVPKLQLFALQVKRDHAVI